MVIPPKYFLTPKISELLSEIHANKEVINTVTIPKDIETNIRRRSSLKSSLFSARIEGNTATLNDIAHLPSKDQRRVEVYNILKAIEIIYEKHGKDITLPEVLKLHAIIMHGLTVKSSSSKFRKEVSAIFNNAGIAIYMPPPPRYVEPLLEKLLKFVNSQKEMFVPIRACIAHYVFEKIHPFLDGNGRVGRLLLQYVLQKGGYGMKGFLPIEEYLDSHRSSYYRSLENSEKDITDYLEFMLEAIEHTSNQTKKNVLAQKNTAPEDYLLPRRTEILYIIRDHKLINFDIIRRRFMAVNKRTLRYDIKKLVDAGFVKKLGTTKGVYYAAL